MPSSRAASGALAALAHPEFRNFILGRAFASLAMQMQNLAVGLQVWDVTHRKIDLAYVGLAQFLPIITLSIAAGQLADKIDRRYILVACNVVFGAASFGLFLLSRSAHPSFWAILALLVVSGVARAFYSPAGSSIVPALVPKNDFPNAVSLNSALWQGTAILGPSLAGALYAIHGTPDPVYATSAVLLILGGVQLARLKPLPVRSDRGPATLATALAGVRYVRKHKLLLGAISLDFFAVFLGGATALLPVYATDILHVGAHGLGVLRAAPALGAGLMAAYLAFRPLGGNAGAKMLTAVGIFGAATVVFGLSTWVPLSVVMLAVLGAADMVSVVVRGTLIQAATPDAMRGRVSAVNMMFIGASNELGEFESGSLAEFFGAVPSVVIGGLGTLLVVGLWSWRFAPLRKVDRLEDVTPADDTES